MDEPRLVVVDANVLINFARIGRLDLLTCFGDLRFCAPPEVLVEVINERIVIDRFIESGELGEIELASSEELAVFSELSKVMGSGEAACLAIASQRGGLVASDEKRVFLREAVARLGPDRILNTPGILLLAIRRGLLSVEEADRWKTELETNRFKMKFRTFRDLT